jgi:hypothetical protein
MDTSKAIGRADRYDDELAAAETPPWEMIEAGRYQPRRIRGSCRGRELG